MPASQEAGICFCPVFVQAVGLRPFDFAQGGL
jgi:hypothetical protein